MLPDDPVNKFIWFKTYMDDVTTDLRSVTMMDFNCVNVLLSCHLYSWLRKLEKDILVPYINLLSTLDIGSLFYNIMPRHFLN